MSMAAAGMAATAFVTRPAQTSNLQWRLLVFVVEFGIRTMIQKDPSYIEIVFGGRVVSKEYRVRVVS